MAEENLIVKAMIEGYGEGFPNLEELFALKASDDDILELLSPIPELGRYRGSVRFLEEVTSGAAYGKLRFRVMIEYFIALGNFFDKEVLAGKIVPYVMNTERKALRKIGLSLDEIVRAQLIEKFTGHDTAAAGDFIKLSIAEHIPTLAKDIEGVHFAATSEDVIGNVTGLMGNNLVYRHFFPAVVNFWGSMIDFCEGSLILPALTHKQAAEPTTQRKIIAVRLDATVTLLEKLIKRNGELQPFSGKMGGAVGNLTGHYAAYPDLDWWHFARQFVEGLGLHYHEMTDQCSSYVMEAFIFRIIIDVLEQIVKFAEDFCDLVSCPGQLFVKLKKAGEKGSSIMLGKTNLWAIEGGIVMLRKTQNNLNFLATQLQRYPHQGNMARSYLMRAMGGDFMPAFIGINRIANEIGRCVPNNKNISECLESYPGMCGSALQTFLKANRIEGDAYRLVQGISINLDGSYADASEFKAGLKGVMRDLNLGDDVKARLLRLTDFAVLVNPAEEKSTRVMTKISGLLNEFHRLCQKVKI